MASIRQVMIRKKRQPYLYVHYDPKINTYLVGDQVGGIVFTEEKGQEFIRKNLPDPGTWEIEYLPEDTKHIPINSPRAQEFLKEIRKSPGYSK